MDELRYPTGRFKAPVEYTPARRREYIEIVTATPAKLRDAVKGFKDAQLDTPYRPDGWTVRQVVHHVADSHMNAYVRFRLGLTEDKPPVKPYDEAKWAQLADASSMPVEPSLRLVEALHERWVTLMRSMTEQDFSRAVVHPEHGERPLDYFLALYAWHGPHHTAQITGLRAREGW